MSLMGTLAKIAIGYASARGVDALTKTQRTGGASGGLLGGAKIDRKQAQAEHAPGMEQIQDMMGQMGSGMAGLQDMVTKMAAQNGFDLNSILGGLGGGASSQSAAKDSGSGGLLSSASGGADGTGLAGILAALGGAASASGKGMGGMLDQFSKTEAAPQAEDTAALMLRAMIQSAKADGEIDKAEQAKIMETVGDDADADDIAFIRKQLKAPVDIEGLAADTPQGLQTQIYSMSLMSIRVDKQSEAEYLDTLARALGLNQQTVNALHLQMGVQPLYA